MYILHRTPEFGSEIAMTLGGYVKCVQVLDGCTRSVLRTYKQPEPKNLELDVGMDMWASMTIDSMMQYGHFGTDGTPTNVTQTGLQGWAKRTATYANGSCGTVVSLGQWSNTIAYDGDTETGTVTYREFAVSPYNTDNPITFNRFVFDTPITIYAGQRIRVIFTLNVGVPNNAAPVYNSNPNLITGWSNSMGHLGVYFLKSDYGGMMATHPMAFAYLNADGTVSDSDFRWMEPSITSGQRIVTSTVSTVGAHVADAGESDNRYTGQVSGSDPTLSTYVPGSFTRTKTWVAGLNYCNLTGIRSIAVYYDNTTPIYFVFDNAFNKANTHELNWHIHYTWARAA
jgi:hypothetical protein